LKASRKAGSQIWGRLDSGPTGYRLRNAVLFNGSYIVGDTDSAALGVLDETKETHFGAIAEWQFDTVFVYNKAACAILQSAELVGLPGSAPFGDNSTMFLSCTLDGRTWGAEKPLAMGVTGNRTKRLQWRPRWRMRKMMGLRFRGYGAALASFSSLEISAVPLAW